MTCMCYLQITDDGMVDIFLLLLKEVVAHGVEGVRAKFGISDENLWERKKMEAGITVVYGT